MEPGIREFFRRLVTTISFLVLWMAINIAVGIKYGYGFFEGRVHWYNILFYIWVAASLTALIWFYIRLWKKPIENLQD